jgi:hypothetical protein
MSSVQAITEDIQFTAKIASFSPLQAELLSKQFGVWLQERGNEQNFIVWRVNIEGASKDYHL